MAQNFKRQRRNSESMPKADVAHGSKIDREEEYHRPEPPALAHSPSFGPVSKFTEIVKTWTNDRNNV